jgi:hypothetical protein
MMAEDPKDILKDAQQQTITRRSPGRQNSSLTSTTMNSIERTVNEMKTETPNKEEEESYEQEGNDVNQDEVDVKTIITRIKPLNIAAAVKAVDEDDDCYDTSSGLWRMLAAYDDLVLSQPGYSTHQHGESHWLDVETVPWGTMEESRSKCLQWLDEHIEEQASPVVRRRH